MARYIVVLCLLCACVSKQESSIARRFIMENSATVGLPEGRIALIAKVRLFVSARGEEGETFTHKFSIGEKFDLLNYGTPLLNMEM